MKKDFFENYINSYADYMINTDFSSISDFNHISKDIDITNMFETLLRETIVIKLIQSQLFEKVKPLILQWNMQNYVDTEGKCILKYAIDTKNIEFINFLLSNGSLVTDEILKYKYPILNSAISFILIQHLISTSSENIDNNKAEIINIILSMAITFKENKLAKFIFDNKLYTEDVCNIFSNCIYNGNVEFAKYLLDTGLDININGLMYLKNAILYISNDMLNFLIQHNIDLKKYGKEVMDYAFSNLLIDKIKVLKTAGVKVDDIYTYSIFGLWNQKFIYSIIDLCQDEDDEETIRKFLNLAINSNHLKLAEYIVKNTCIEISFKDKFRLFRLKLTV